MALSHLIDKLMAEEKRFELLLGVSPLMVFETIPFDHLGIPPKRPNHYTSKFVIGIEAIQLISALSLNGSAFCEAMMVKHRSLFGCFLKEGNRASCLVMIYAREKAIACCRF